MALTQYRRHKPDCRHYGFEGQQAQKNCKCPIYVKGTLNHQPVRRSMDQVDWNAAGIVIANWVKAGKIDGVLAGQSKTLAAAVAEYQTDLKVFGNKGKATLGKVKLLLEDRLIPFCKSRHIVQLVDVSPAVIREFRLTWVTTDPYIVGDKPRKPLGLRMIGQMQNRLKAFFLFCIASKWLTENPATVLSKVATLKVQVQPFDPDEMNRILAACDRLPVHPNNKYDRRARARAMVLLMRWTGLRFGDVVMLKWSELEPYLDRVAQKNKSRIRMFLADPVKAALYNPDSTRRRFSANDEYVFATGRASQAMARTTCGAMLNEVFALSGVRGAHAHRFRHTFVVEALKVDPPIPMEDIAAAIGDQVATVQEYYSAFVPARHELMMKRLAAVPGFSSAIPGPPSPHQASLYLVSPRARAR